MGITVPGIGTNAASINATFTLTVINRAAEIVAGATPAAESGCDAFSALQQARDEFIATETRRQKSGRTYAWPLLLKDIGQYVKSREPAYADSFSPISEWSRAVGPAAAAKTLREAALEMSCIVEERTKWVTKLEAMSEQERAEYELMRKTDAFLKEHGLIVKIAWDREDPNDPIDYRGTVDGVSWAFELTELRIDPNQGYHRKVGHPKENKLRHEQLEELAAPMPQIPDGPDALQKALDTAVTHGSKASKLKVVNGARYCLVLYNRQFLYVPDWDAITMPDCSEFDAILILHQEMYPMVQTWEVLRNGFAKPLRSHNVNDLGDIIAFKNSNLTRRSDPERVKAALRHLQSLHLTEDDVRAAIAETRAEKRAQ